MRLFTGLDLPADVTANLKAAMAILRPAARIQWSPPENLHITTKFIGEWPEEKLSALQAGLRGLRSREPLRVSIRQVGFFPNQRAPRVFWCGIDAPGLADLAAATDAATAALGIPREDRAYSPHLTLARIRSPLDLAPLHRAIAALPSLEFGAFEARTFYLYRSRLSPSGSVYTKLAEFPLTK